MSDPRVISNIYPRFYPILPSVGPADITFSHADSPVERKFLADLIIFYAFDLGNEFELVSNGAREEMHISEDELYEASLQNLRALNLKVLSHKNERFVMLTAGGNFEAPLLLLPEIWDSVAEIVEGKVVAAVPARDILIFTGDSMPENLAELRRRTSQAIEKAEHPLSRCFFRRAGCIWQKYQGFGE